MFQNKVINKIPGDLPPPARKENQGYIEDLGKKQKFELEELLNRQIKLLSNKTFISKLPDKGEKIRAFHNKILKELEHKNEVETAANLLSRLNLASEGKAAMNELEWTGKYNKTKNNVKIVELDSDDEEDPLKILAQPTGSGVHNKKIIHLSPEESLIKEEDLAEIKSFQTEHTEHIEHITYIINKVQDCSEELNKEKGAFKPYRTIKSNVHDPKKEKERKQNKYWEVTAATPPFMVHGAAKVISLSDSLKLQKDQAEKLQETQAKHAAERLAEQLGLHTIDPTPVNIGAFRQQNEKESDFSTSDDEEETEVHDDEDTDKGGTVVFTIDSIET